MSGKLEQAALFDPNAFGRPLPLVGEQKDIRYFGTIARSVLNGTETTGMGFWSINPYVGCAFGCAYCYARYAHRWVLDRHATANPEHDEMQAARDDLPPWLAFERRIFVKQNAADVLRKTLRHGSDRHLALLKGETIVIGTATDPFQPAERRFRVTRSVLEVLADHPGLSVCIITKSPLITRDIDLLRRINRELGANFDLGQFSHRACYNPRLGRIEMVEGRHDVFEQRLDPAALCDTLKLRGDRSIHRPASLVAHDDEQRGVEVRACVLQRSQDRRAEYVSCHAHDEKLPEPGVEDEFRWHAAVAATENRGVGLLSFGEFRQNFLLHRREPRVTADEARIAGLEPLERLIRSARGLPIRGHRRPLPQGVLHNGRDFRPRV